MSLTNDQRKKEINNILHLLIGVLNGFPVRFFRVSNFLQWWHYCRSHGGMGVALGGYCMIGNPAGGADTLNKTL